MADENYWGLKLAPRTKKNASGHNYACAPKGGRCNAQFGRMEQYNSVTKNQTKTSGVGQRDRNLANQRSDDNQRGKWNETSPRVANSKVETYRGNFARFQKPGSTSWTAPRGEAEYVQAVCQFLVLPGNYEAYLADCDLPIPWEKVQELRLRDDQPVICPICLDTPSAAQMTRCGHIYCYPCILHYLALSDHEWRFCPICNHQIAKFDLRSVSCNNYDMKLVGDTMKFILMRRDRGSSVALPVSLWHSMVQPPVLDDSAAPWSKLVQVSHEEVQRKIITRERSELNSRLAEIINEPEACFVLEALNLIEQREVALISEQNVEINGPDVKKSVEGNFATGPQRKSTSDESECYYFYQLADGHQTYLHKLNARMLVHEYGSLEQAPLEFEAQVIEIQRLAMSPDIRDRYRFLSHLPLGACFQLMEVKPPEHILSPETVFLFEGEMNRRTEQRRKRFVEEHRLARNAERREYEQLLKQRGWHVEENTEKPPGASSADEYPVLKFVPSAQKELQAIAGSQSEDTAQSPEETTGQALSFASMLKKQGRQKQPSLSEAKPQELSAFSAGASGSVSIIKKPDDEEELKAPEFQNTLGMALQAAFEQRGADKRENKRGKKGKQKKKAEFSLEL